MTQTIDPGAYSAALADFVVNADPLKDGEVVEAAKNALLDGLACLIGGTREALGQVMHSYARTIGSWSSGSSVICSDVRISPAMAAMVNATSGHSLCYDDTSNNMMGHPTVVVLPAAMAVGEMVGSAGDDLLAAYAVGSEIAVRTSQIMAPFHYQIGWHPTGICGAIGAAAACARLLELTPSQTANALSIAACDSQGIRASFGSMTMIHNAGLGARGGVEAALLAREGMTVPLEVFSGDIGYFSLHSMKRVRGAESAISAAEPGDPYELVSPGLDVKPYPCGSLGHRCIQGLIDLKAETEFMPAQIEAIRCRIPDLHKDVLRNTDPQDVLESRISLVYPIAVAALRGSCSTADFSLELLEDPVLRELMAKVTIDALDMGEANGSEIFSAAGEVSVELRGGETLVRTVKDVKGSPSCPLSADEELAKLRDCVEPSIGQDGVTELRNIIDGVEDSNVRDITAFLTDGWRDA
jgi:2-methylcitrate dehydratase PrpD